MPAFLETKLKTAAAQKGLSGKKADAYVYGTLQNLGAISGNKETDKGREMQAKHDRDMGRKTSLKQLMTKGLKRAA